MSGTHTAYSAQSDSAAAAREILNSLSGASPRVVIFFAGVAHDGAVLGAALQQAFPRACVLGCSSNGEFSDRGHGKGGVVAIAIGQEVVGRCAVALADVSQDIDAGIGAAASRLSSQLGCSLRSLDEQHWAGLALLEGARGREERINVAFGDIAPFMPFVGGSAGDNITFSGTWTFADGMLAADGTALLLCEMLRPFRYVKACNFTPTDTLVTCTRVDSDKRLILELDGETAAQYFARRIGVEKSELQFAHFLANPLGLMIDGEAWLRSGIRAEGDALFFACSVIEGAQLHFMQATNLVEDTRQKLQQAAADLGTPIRGAVFFNCAYRMLEAQITGQESAYHAVLSTLPHIGVQSNGESFLGHINQTLTGLIFG